MEFSYDGLVLSFLDHKIDGNRVKFSGSVENKDITPLFLNNLKIVGGENKDGERDFEADLMSPSEAEKYFSEKSESQLKYKHHGYRSQIQIGNSILTG